MMAENEILVSERVAKLVDWANEKGQAAIQKMVRDCMESLRGDRFWDIRMEPNDGPEQWKHGGDCLRCRRLGYCKKKCKANRLLKSFSTPYLWSQYLLEHPEEQQTSETTKEILKAADIDFVDEG